MDEVVILRSRVEEQAELVMLMKSRNDEASKEIQRLRDTVKQLEEREAERGAHEHQLKAENEKLKANFATLSKNHEEIIKLKDEYKGENANLRKKAKETDERAAALDAHIARERGVRARVCTPHLPTLAPPLFPPPSLPPSCVFSASPCRSHHGRVLREIEEGGGGGSSTAVQGSDFGSDREVCVLTPCDA